MEFKIDGRNENFRIKEIAPTRLLALRTVIDLDDLDQTDKLYEFIFENVEIEIQGQWMPVKEKNRQIYWPADLKNDLNSLQQISSHFLNDFLKPVFQSSNESK